MKEINFTSGFSCIFTWGTTKGPASSSAGSWPWQQPAADGYEGTWQPSTSGYFPNYFPSSSPPRAFPKPKDIFLPMDSAAVGHASKTDLFGNVLNTDVRYSIKSATVYMCIFVDCVLLHSWNKCITAWSYKCFRDSYVSFVTLVINGKKEVFFDTAFENTSTSCKMKLYSKMYPKLQDTSTIKQINRHVFMYREHQNTKQLLI